MILEPKNEDKLLPAASLPLNKRTHVVSNKNKQVVVLSLDEEDEEEDILNRFHFRNQESPPRVPDSSSNIFN